MHASRYGDHELKLAVDHGVSISIAPQIDLTTHGLGLPPIERLLHAGLAPTLTAETAKPPGQVTCSRSCG